MAITKDLSEITVDLDANTITVVDNSVYTSPTRPNVGVFLKIFKTDLDGNRNYLTTTPNDDEPTTDSEWSAEYSTDGWHQLLYVAIPIWEATTYAKYDAVYNDVTGIVYRSKVNANVVTVAADLLVTANWEVISDPTSLCLNVGTASQSVNLNTITSIGTINTLLKPIIQDCFESTTGEAFLEATSSYLRSQDVRKYELLGLAVDAIGIANDRQEYALGEIIARRAIALCSDC